MSREPYDPMESAVSALWSISEKLDELISEVQEMRKQLPNPPTTKCVHDIIKESFEAMG